MACNKYSYLLDISRYIIYTSFTILILNVIWSKDVSNISLIWVLLVLTAQSFLFTYGLLNRFYGYILISGFIVSGILYIFYLKILHLQKVQFIDII